MALFKFFNLPKPIHFDYHPRYWDPKKEALEKQLKASEERTGADVEGMKTRVSSGFRRRQYQESKTLRSRYAKRTNLRLLGILAALVVITLVLLNSWLPTIISAIEK